MQTVIESNTGDRYHIQRKLGEGGFGETLLATRGDDDQVVVIKRLHLGRLSQWKALELFEREAAVLAELNHEAIPRYLDFFELGQPGSGQGFALVQEFIDGHDLERGVLAARGVDVQQATGWFMQLLEVLAYLHERSPSVIHRDITPRIS